MTAQKNDLGSLGRFVRRLVGVLMDCLLGVLHALIPVLAYKYAQGPHYKLLFIIWALGFGGMSYSLFFKKSDDKNKIDLENSVHSLIYLAATYAMILKYINFSMANLLLLATSFGLLLVVFAPPPIGSRIRDKLLKRAK